MSKRPAKLARDGPRQMGSTEDAELEFGEGCNWKWKNGTKLRLTGRLSVSGKKELRECVYTFSLVPPQLQADGRWKRPYS